MIDASIIIAYKDIYQLEVCANTVYRSIEHLNPKLETEVICSAKPNPSHARNFCVENSEGNILIFIDSDAEATDGWLHEILKPFNNSKVGAVGGSNLLKPSASYREQLADKLLTFPLATWKGSSRYRVHGIQRETDESELTSCNLAIRRQAFLEVGGFPEDIVPAEENVLLNRIQKRGWKLVYNPLAIVLHDRPKLIMPYLRKIFYYGTGRGKMLKKHEGSMTVRPHFSKDWLILSLALGLHYGAYFSGVAWGYLQR